MNKNKIILIAIIPTIFFILLLEVWNKIQDTVFFHPYNDIYSFEKLKSIDEFKEINIIGKDFNLNGWFWNIDNSKQKKPLIIFFTGNAQNSSNTLYYFYQNKEFKKYINGFNLMIIDYPGYGYSTGKPSEKNMFLASKKIYNYATKMEEVDNQKIVIMGYSIGTGVACYCASENKNAGVILIAPYDNALNLYNDNLNIFHGVFSYLPKYKFDSLNYAKKINEPVIIFTSKKDEVINYKHSLNLSKNFSDLYKIIVFDNDSHNDYLSNSKLLIEMNSFLNNIK